MQLIVHLPRRTTTTTVTVIEIATILVVVIGTGTAATGIGTEDHLGVLTQTISVILKEPSSHYQYLEQRSRKRHKISVNLRRLYTTMC